VAENAMEVLEEEDNIGMPEKQEMNLDTDNEEEVGKENGGAHEQFPIEV